MLDPIHTQFFSRQMNLQFSIGDLVIVGADFPHTGANNFAGEGQGGGGPHNLQIQRFLFTIDYGNHIIIRGTKMRPH